MSMVIFLLSIGILFLCVDTVVSLKIIRAYWHKKKQKLLEKQLQQKNSNSDIFWNAPKEELLNRIYIGQHTYGILNIADSTVLPAKLHIGRYCSIALGVWFVLGSEHSLHTLSTYPFKVRCFGYEKESLSKGDIIVSDDVWIGLNATICSGVVIGQGAVVGAGAVVTKDVPPYAIVGGVPAKVIRYRFSPHIVEKLSAIDVSVLFDNLKEEQIDTVYTELTENNIEEILKKLGDNTFV